MNHNNSSRHLDPPEAPQRRRVPFTNNMTEIWVPCEYCEEYGNVLEHETEEFEEFDPTTGTNVTIEHEVEVQVTCPRCNGEKGEWSLEVDE